MAGGLRSVKYYYFISVALVGFLILYFHFIHFGFFSLLSSSKKNAYDNDNSALFNPQDSQIYNSEKYIHLRQDTFQKVSNTTEKFYVYSAYVENYRDRLNIRVLGGAFSRTNKTVYCQFIEEKGSHYATVPGKIETTVTEYSYVLPYSPIFIICMANQLNSIPSFVSITLDPNYEYIEKHNLLSVHNPYNETMIAKFAVCVKPMYNMENPFEILEWMEYYKMMGVEHFTFYNISTGPKTSLLLKSYKNMVTILTWNTPYVFEVEMRMHAQFLQANDCNFRYRGRAEYVIMLDFDEFLVPYGNSINTFQKLFQNINSKIIRGKKQGTLEREIAQYQFRTAYYFMSWQNDEGSANVSIPDDPEAAEIIKKTRIWMKTKRMDINRFKHVSKIVVRPTKVIEPGIHWLERAVMDNGIELEVPSDFGYVYHYRVCTDYEQMCSNKSIPITRDKHAHDQFGKLLAINIAEKIRNLKKQEIEIF